jgi:carboxyl-terminal processing protease
VKHLLETTMFGLLVLAIGAGCPPAKCADQPNSKASAVPAGLAALAQNAIDTVLEHDIDPPTRQQMILTGIKAVYKAAGKPVPERLSSRVSMITTPEQVLSLLEEVWPAQEGEAVPAKALEEAFLNGILSSLSGAAELMPEKERKVQEQSAGNRYVGIHIALGMDGSEKRPVIHEVIEGGPADRVGVKQNDRIEQIEGVDTTGMTLRDAIDRLRGDEGTNVTIKVRQPGSATARQYTIRRGQHPRPTIAGWQKQASGEWDYRMGDSQNIAYIKISEMAGSTPHELRKLAARLEGEGLHAAVLDLRGLGSLSEHCALLMADSLLDHGTIGRVRSSHGETTYQADSEAILRRWPMVVLVDGLTSGAPEWLAAALQDNKRAVLVGAPTASASMVPGEAIVNSAFRLGSSDYSVLLTSGILERGDGRALSSLERSSSAPGRIRSIRARVNKAFGVHPDHVIPQTAQTMAAQQRLPRERLLRAPGTAEQKAVEILRRLLDII